MHRVELKDFSKLANTSKLSVPNAPCGVESCIFDIRSTTVGLVPNAPCGVERLAMNRYGHRAYLGS